MEKDAQPIERLVIFTLFTFFQSKSPQTFNKSNQNSGTLLIYIFPRRDVQDGGTRKHFTLNSPQWQHQQLHD